jgi:hypothetical protein
MVLGQGRGTGEGFFRGRSRPTSSKGRIQFRSPVNGDIDEGPDASGKNEQTKKNSGRIHRLRGARPRAGRGPGNGAGNHFPGHRHRVTGDILQNFYSVHLSYRHCTFPVILKCHDPEGELYFLSIARNRVTVASYTGDGIRWRFERWTDSVPARA